MRFRVAVIVSALALSIATGARANVSRRLEAVVRRAIQSNYDVLHGCYRKVLSEDRSRGGTVFVRVTLGYRDLVRSATVERDELKSATVSDCIVRWIRGWTLRGAARAGADVGSDVMIPITFRADPRQFSVWLDDVPTRRLPAGAESQRLLTQRNVGALQFTMTQINVTRGLLLGKRARADQVLYVLGGAGTVQPLGMKLRERTALWLPPGRGARVAPGPSGLRVLHLALPLTARRPAVASRPIVVRPADPLRLQKGKLKVFPLLHRENLGHQRFYFGLIQAAAGTSIPRHRHATAAEAVFVQGGRGKMSVGNRQRRLGADQALFVAPGAEHWVRIEQSLVAVQLYAPGGPESRFFAQAAKLGGGK